MIRDLLVKQGKKGYRVVLWVMVVGMHLLYVWAYWANNQHAAEHKQAAKIWVKNYNQKCGKDIDEHYLNLVMLNLNAILVNVITGLLFGFNGNLNCKSVIPFMKGQWEFNKQRYGKLGGYFVFFLVQVVLFSIGFIVFSPVLLILGKTAITSFIYFNLAGLVSSYIYAKWTLRVSDRFLLI